MRRPQSARRSNPKASPNGGRQRQVSVGGGRTTCAFLRRDGSLLYASTHGHGPGCLETPDGSQGYVWPLHPEMDLWIADAEGGHARILFASEGYDAEATICHRDGRIIFTSTMDGDLELYTMESDGSDLTRLTFTPGYDGGAFFSPECSKIVWRASRPTGADLDDYRALLARNLVRPSALEILCRRGRRLQRRAGHRQRSRKLCAVLCTRTTNAFSSRATSAVRDASATSRYIPVPRSITRVDAHPKEGGPWAARFSSAWPS